MKSNDNFIFDEHKISKIINIISSIVTNGQENFDFLNSIYDEYISHNKISRNGIIIYFTDIFLIKTFNKIFIFKGTIEYDKIKSIFWDSKKFKSYIYDNSIGLILNNNLLSNEDFYNLKKCYMLTEKVSFNKNGEIYCKYNPYYLIELELIGKTLTILINVTNSVCELNMKNVKYDLKTFLNKVLENIDKDDLKEHYQILQYYASLKDD